MPRDYSTEKQISVLKALDRVDEIIVSLEARRSEVRGGVEKLKTEIASFHSGLAELERELASCEEQQRTAEKELDRVERKLRKLSRGSGAVSEKEYEAAEREQAHLAARKDELEEEILACMEQAEELQERRKALQRHVAERRAAIGAEYDALKQQYEELGAQLTRQKQDRDLLIPQLDPEYRYTYQRLMQRYGDRATVSVVEDRCTGCHLHVPPQHVVDVLTGRGLHTCQHCGRFVLPREEETERSENANDSSK